MILQALEQHLAASNIFEARLETGINQPAALAFGQLKVDEQFPSATRPQAGMKIEMDDGLVALERDPEVAAPADVAGQRLDGDGREVRLTRQRFEAGHAGRRRRDP